MTGDRFLVRFMRRQSTKAGRISEICTRMKFSNYTDLKSLVCGPEGFPARNNQHGYGFRKREMLHRDVTVVLGHQPRSQKITFLFLSTQSIHYRNVGRYLVSNTSARVKGHRKIFLV